MASVSTNAPPITNYIRGDSRLLLIPCYEADGVTPFDLTGCEVYFTLNLSDAPPDDGTDTTAAIKKSVSSDWLQSYTSPTVNLPNLNNAYYIAQIQLANADTQPLTADEYNYDLQLKDSGGNISSLGQNTWTVIDDITTRVS